MLLIAEHVPTSFQALAVMRYLGVLVGVHVVDSKSHAVKALRSCQHPMDRSVQVGQGLFSNHALTNPLQGSTMHASGAQHQYRLHSGHVA